MLLVISPITYPHYEGMEVDVEPTEKILLIDEGLFKYIIKEQFKMPHVIKNDILYCVRADYELRKFHKDLQTNNSGEAVPSKCMKQIVLAELHQIQDDLSNLFKELEERTEQLREILNQRGYKILPNIMNAVLKHEFSDEFRETITQPMKVKARPTKASLMKHYNLIKAKMRTFLKFDMIPAQEEERHIKVPAGNMTMKNYNSIKQRMNTYIKLNMIRGNEEERHIKVPTGNMTTRLENVNPSTIAKSNQQNSKEAVTTPTKDPLTATEEQLLKVDPNILQKTHPVEESDVILPENKSTETVVTMSQTVNQVDYEQTVTIEEPLQPSSAERKANSPKNASPAKRQRGRPSKCKPQMSKVASKPPISPAKRGRKSKASKLIKPMPELEPELIDTYKNMNTQVGFLEYFKLCTPEIFRKMKADFYKPKRRSVVRNKYSEYLYGDE